MAHPTVAAVSADPDIRLALAKAFDAAPASWQIVLYDDPSKASGDVVVWGRDFPAEDGVAFDPACPERMLDAVREALSSESGPTIVVTSPSGGTGTTTVALHLAQAFARRGPACFLDLDVRWGAGMRLGVTEPNALSWAKLDDSPDSLMKCALPVPGGFRALLAPAGDSEVPDPPALIRRAATHFESIVVDVTDPGLLRASISSAKACVCVVPPTLSGADRARRFLRDSPSTRWAIVINRLGPGGTMDRSEIERRLERRIALELPHCPALRDNEDDQRLLSSPMARWFRALARLAEVL